MPTYVNLCTAGHEFESIQRITDKPIRKCIKCSAKVKRVISGTSFVLNGLGWPGKSIRGKR